jgi:hypothetical protein
MRVHFSEALPQNYTNEILVHHVETTSKDNFDFDIFDLQYGYNGMLFD